MFKFGLLASIFIATSSSSFGQSPSFSLTSLLEKATEAKVAKHFSKLLSTGMKVAAKKYLNGELTIDTVDAVPTFLDGKLSAVKFILTGKNGTKPLDLNFKLNLTYDGNGLPYSLIAESSQNGINFKSKPVLINDEISTLLKVFGPVYTDILAIVKDHDPKNRYLSLTERVRLKANLALGIGASLKALAESEETQNELAKVRHNLEEKVKSLITGLRPVISDLPTLSRPTKGEAPTVLPINKQRVEKDLAELKKLLLMLAGLFVVAIFLIAFLGGLLGALCVVNPLAALIMLEILIDIPLLLFGLMI